MALVIRECQDSVVPFMRAVISFRHFGDREKYTSVSQGDSHLGAEALCEYSS